MNCTGKRERPKGRKTDGRTAGTSMTPEEYAVALDRGIAAQYRAWSERWPGRRQHAGSGETNPMQLLMQGVEEMAEAVAEHTARWLAWTIAAALGACTLLTWLQGATG